jgi:hypothetical protein
VQAVATVWKTSLRTLGFVFITRKKWHMKAEILFF